MGVDWGILAPVKAFLAPQESLGDLDALSAATLISAASDITLIVDAGGIVRDVAVSNDELWRDLESGGWLNRPFVQTVAMDSRGKVEALLKDATSTATSRWRHINHVTDDGRHVPLLYCSVQVGHDRRIVVFGRDMRAVSTLQQRLVSAQQSMERDYSRLREVEMRYRLLFTMSAEAVLILDAATMKILDANPAARQLFGLTAGRIVAHTLAEMFDADSVAAVQSHLDTVRAGRVAADARARLLNGHTDVRVGASLFRQESGVLFLVRVGAVQGVEQEARLPDAKTKLLKAVENAPDGFVVTGEDGRILIANAAFLEMVDLASEEQVRGQPLDQWIGQSGVELNVLIGNLRQRGSVRAFLTTVRGQADRSTQVEISAVSIRNGGQPSFGFVIRNVGQRLVVEPQPGRELPRSVEQLTELVGRVTLKELVRETTDLIERLCIEAALQLSGDNRASAAQMLGLSRQSLYMKLRRYGLVEAAAYGQN